MATKPIPILRELTLHDLAAATSFSDRAYRANYVMFQPKMFDWQYNHCGGGNHSIDCGAIGAIVNNEVVGACLIGRYPILVDGNRKAGGWIHFWFSRADWGPLGIALFQRASRDLAFLGGPAIEIGAASVMRRMQRPFVWFEPERLISIVDPDTTAILSLSQNAHTLAALRLMKPILLEHDVEASNVDRFGDEYQAIWLDVARNFSLATDRTSQYMNWRYCDHPMMTYRKLLCRGPDGPAIYVWREEITEGPTKTIVARLCEVIGSPAAIRTTFAGCYRTIARSGVAFIDFFCSNSTVNGALVAGGMLPAIVRPGLDLPYRLRPVENALSKRIDYYYLFPKQPAPLSCFDYHRTYFTRGDSNQDIPAS